MKNILILLFCLLGYVDAFAQYPVNRSGVSIVEGNGLSPWEINTTYAEDRVVVMNKRIYVSKVDHASGVLFSADLANWDELSAGGITIWTTGAEYVPENIVYDGLTDKLYRATAIHTAGATLDADMANWITLSLIKSASSTDNTLVRMDGVSGSAIQESGVIIDDSDNITTSGGFTAGKLDAVSTTESSSPCPSMTEAERDLITPSEGSCIFNNSTKATNVWDGSVWVPLESGLDYRTPLMGKGEIFASNGITNGTLAACDDDEILIWDALEDAGFKCTKVPSTTPTTTLGDIIFNGGAGDVRYPIGTVGQVLTSDGSVPQWEDAASGSGVPLMAKGSILTSSGVVNGERLKCDDGEMLEWDATKADGVKCVTIATGGAPANVVESPSSGSYVASSKTLTAPLMTTTGGPVTLMVTSDESATTLGGHGTGSTVFKRDGVQIGAIVIGESVTFLDSPPAGAYVYSVTLFGPEYVRLVAIEQAAGPAGPTGPAGPSIVAPINEVFESADYNVAYGTSPANLTVSLPFTLTHPSIVHVALVSAAASGVGGIGPIGAYARMHIKVNGSSLSTQTTTSTGENMTVPSTMIFLPAGAHTASWLVERTFGTASYGGGNGRIVVRAIGIP